MCVPAKRCKVRGAEVEEPKEKEGAEAKEDDEGEGLPEDERV